MKVNKKIIGRILAVVLAYALITFLIKGGVLNRQYTSLIVPIGVNIMLAVSLNLVTGFLGELSLGHAGFMSLGAYAGALFTLNTDMGDLPSIIVAMLIGGVVAAIFGFLIGVPVLRLQGDYLAIVTLAFGEIIKSVLNSMTFTNGPKGLSKIPLISNYQHYTLVFIVTVITILVISNIVDSRHGRAVCSVRDNYIAAESIGVHVSRFKIMAFVVSAFFAGVAGVLYAHNVGIIKPTTFDYNKSIEILVIVVLGGMGSIRGSIIAAVCPDDSAGDAARADNLRMLLYSIVLIAMMLFNQSGLKERLLERFSGNKEKAGE